MAVNSQCQVTVNVRPEIMARVAFIAKARKWSVNTAIEEMLAKAAGLKNKIDGLGLEANNV